MNVGAWGICLLPFRMLIWALLVGYRPKRAQSASTGVTCTCMSQGKVPPLPCSALKERIVQRRCCQV
eukprot:6488757-Amphidinium_carterae.1